MARKVILVGEYGESIYLNETETHAGVPPKQYGWCKSAVFRRFEGLKDGKPIQVCVWEGKKKSAREAGK